MVEVIMQEHGEVELYLLHPAPLYQVQLVRAEEQQQVHQDVLLLVLKLKIKI
jgi:hypothetical protein